VSLFCHLAEVADLKIGHYKRLRVSGIGPIDRLIALAWRRRRWT
jgi:hypothetical protein